MDVVQTTCELVRLPSVNPMGQPATGEHDFEWRVTDYVEQRLAALGVDFERHCVIPETASTPPRDNILAILPGEPVGAPCVMLEAHQDTVPTVGMTIPPWDGNCHEGRVHGRGSCDIKGGIAVHLAVLAKMARKLPAPRPTLVMACTVDEECGFSGAKHLRQLWQSGSSTVLPSPPTAIVVAEPTSLQVVVAHRGVVRWRIHTLGTAAHSSTPEQGHNAIYDMADLLDALRKYATEIVPGLAQHPRLGRPTLSVGTIRGGVSVNTVPDKCSIEIDRRLLPGEDPPWARQHVIDYLKDHCRYVAGVEHERPSLSSPGLSDAGNGELGERLAETVRQSGRPCELAGAAYGTDAAILASDGIPTVVFGPGSIEQAHTCDEWVAVEQLEAATALLYEFLLRYSAPENQTPAETRK